MLFSSVPERIEFGSTAHGRQPAKRIRRETKTRPVHPQRGQDKRGRRGPQRFVHRGGGWEGYHRGR